MRLDHSASSATSKQQLPRAQHPLCGETPEKKKKALPSNTQFGFTQGKQKAIPEGTGPAKFGVLPRSLCLSPDTSCRPQPGRGRSKQANRPSAYGLRLTRWLITGRQQHLPPQLGVHRGAEGRHPRCVLRWHR